LAAEAAANSAEEERRRKAEEAARAANAAAAAAEAARRAAAEAAAEKARQEAIAAEKERLRREEEARRAAEARAAAERAERERQRLAEIERLRQAAILAALRAEEAARRMRSSDAYGAVKTPTKDVLNISSLVPQESAKSIERILFEQMSAIELSTVLRHDTVDGIGQRYSIISNLSEVRRSYDPTRELSTQDKLSPLSSRYSINLDSKIPGKAYIINNGLESENSYLDTENNLVSVVKNYVYVDTNGDIVIELDNIFDSELVQVQIDQDGTMYEVNNL